MSERRIPMHKFDCATLASILLWAALGQAQGTAAPDPPVSDIRIQQLKDRLASLEQSMKEVKEQINALEAQHAVAEAVVMSKPSAQTPAPESKKTSSGAEGTMEIYGHVMLDSGYNFGQIDPSWFDVERPGKLPAFKDQFGNDGSVFFGVRQTRFGVKTSTPTNMGDLKTWFEFELFGTGADAGETTFRLRHAYGELGQFGAGQTWSPFMDIDVFPNSLEYWGPNGMVFFRNVQFRWMPVKGNSRVTFAVERPGASADQGIYSDRIELQGIKPKFDMPDFSMEARLGREWGYVKGSGMFRKIGWIDLNKTPSRDLSDDVFGWGVNLSSNVKFGKKDTGRFQAVYGHGIENYMNDAPLDIGVENNFSNPHKPIKGVPLPILGVVSFVDHTWSERYTSTIGYSLVNIWNSDAETPSDLHQGHYALTDLIYYPTKNVLMGGEFQFGRRVNFRDGFNYNDYKLQFSFKYNFSKTFSF